MIKNLMLFAYLSASVVKQLANASNPQEGRTVVGPKRVTSPAANSTFQIDSHLVGTIAFWNVSVNLSHDGIKSPPIFL